MSVTRITFPQDLTNSCIVKLCACYCYKREGGFLKKLEEFLATTPSDVKWRKGKRYNVCGEVLEPQDLQTLMGNSWINDKV
jgi:hypothetical protein